MENAAILHFGAVDYHATMWINGNLVGEHEGGYLPFEFNVIDFLHQGENELAVKVIDPTDNRDAYPDFPFSEIPHGKQSWYGPISGIWQSVWLEFRPLTHLAHIRLDSIPQNATIAVQVSLSEVPPDAYEIFCDVKSSDGQTIGSGMLPGSSGTIHLECAPDLWSPDSHKVL